MSKPFKIFLSIAFIWFIFLLIYGAVANGGTGVRRITSFQVADSPISLPAESVPQDWELWEVTAYANHKKCVGKWLDGYFASGKPTYWGGCAADSRLRFGTIIEVRTPIRGRTHFKVEESKPYLDNGWNVQFLWQNPKNRKVENGQYFRANTTI